jgi:hypothetical protein
LVCHWFPDLTSKVRSGAAARIEDRLMTAEYDARVTATARCSSPAAADGRARGSCLVSPRLFNRNQAITAMVLADRGRRGLRRR